MTVAIRPPPCRPPPRRRHRHRQPRPPSRNGGTDGSQIRILRLHLRGRGCSGIHRNGSRSRGGALRRRIRPASCTSRRAGWSSSLPCSRVRRPRGGGGRWSSPHRRPRGGGLLPPTALRFSDTRLCRPNNGSRHRRSECSSSIIIPSSPIRSRRSPCRRRRLCRRGNNARRRPHRRCPPPRASRA
jgi:hypothetical protein